MTPLASQKIVGIFVGIPAEESRWTKKYLHGRREMPLTDAKIRSLKPTGKIEKHYDGGGLHIKVTEKGSLLWHM
ncbi:MAG: Arm DNA-binding domain-containing protein, partial [Desulfovibrio sp.]|nr:Arm DNA-binding domain-containing protein [Desulfovibrio sp.]